MELLPGNSDSSTRSNGPKPMATTSSVGLTANHETSCDGRLELPPLPGDHCETSSSSLLSGNGKLIVRPAKFHYQRYNISSATAALSLHDSTQVACSSLFPPLASSQGHTHLNFPTPKDPFTSPEWSCTPGPVNSNGFVPSNGACGHEDSLKQQGGHGLSRKQLRRKGWCPLIHFLVSSLIHRVPAVVWIVLNHTWLTSYHRFTLFNFAM